MFESIDHLPPNELDNLIADSTASLRAFITVHGASTEATTQQWITQRMEQINLMSLLRDLREDNNNVESVQKTAN